MIWISLALLVLGFWLAIRQWTYGQLKPARIAVKVDPPQIHRR